MLRNSKKMVLGALVALTTLASASSAFAQASQFFPLAPCRLFDTRLSQGGAGPIAADSSRNFDVLDECGIPNDATAISYNVTVVFPGGGGFITLYPSDVSRPLVAALTFAPGDVVGNGGVVAIGSSNPALSVYAAAATDVVMDVTGYFKPAGM